MKLDSLIRRLPNLETLRDLLDRDPHLLEREAASLGIFTPTSSALESAQTDASPPIPTQPVVPAEILQADGTRAIDKIRREGEAAQLDQDEQFALEAIVQILGRPALLVRDDHFDPPPAGWEILEQYRASIERNLRSVGRIEVEGHPRLDWIGTGFLVAPGAVMTNRHVAEEFCRKGRNGRWTFKPGMIPRIDYSEEYATSQVREFALRGVIGLHEIYDLALLRVAQVNASGQPTPVPLRVSSLPPDGCPGCFVYTAGYPALDTRNNPDIMARIFHNIYNVKRLQPGEMVGIDDVQNLFQHDCSTLGGNSGSGVFDVETGLVLGLHFGGRYQETNSAIALWKLKDDPLLIKAGVNFG
jgi:hypothetical protein